MYFLSPLIVFLVIVKLLVLTAVPFTFTVAFDVLNVDASVSNAVSSFPLIVNVNVFVDDEYESLARSPAHVGAVTSYIKTPLEYATVELELELNLNVCWSL